ncbi:LexA family protein [Bacillus sp. FSL K6-3431]|uniref:LexA family protein n=1 Tax=Bacillus sp. FSL K6-3431 TaxID=2921500 RepID=UPI0030FC4960
MKQKITVDHQRRILAENIKYYLNNKKVTQTEMARDLKLAETTVSSWVKGDRYPRIDKIQLMADYFNIRRSDLTEERKPTNLINVSQQTVRIPILGQIACGDPILVEENYEDYRTVLAEGLPTGKLVYLEAKGDSMHPTIPNGSMVMVREQPDVETGEIAAVMVNGNTEATLKRVKKQGDIIILMPDNPDHAPIIITSDTPVKIIGKAVRSEQAL